MKKLLLLLLLLSVSATGQEIESSPVAPYSLIILTFKAKVDQVNWVVLTVKDSNIVTISGYTDSANKNYIFTGPPGNYLVLANAIITNIDSNKKETKKFIQSSISLTIPADNIKENNKKLFVILITKNYVDPLNFSLPNNNFIWKQYHVNSIVNNNIPILSTPYGEAVKNIVNDDTSALVMVDEEGSVIAPTPIKNNNLTPESVINYVKNNMIK